jgi:hypothetical protein
VNQKKKKLKDNWFIVTSNPIDPNDKGLCIQIIEGPFIHVIIKYKDFKTHKELNEDGSINCDYGYDIIMAPDNVGDRDITDEQGEIFEKQLGEAIIELLWESAENENRNSDIEKSVTE